jgi:predicted transcriptional regulator
MANRVRSVDMLCLPGGKKYNLSSLQPLHKKYRSHFEIIGLVLEAVKAESATPFSIMKHANVNFMQLKKYLKSLTEMGFLEVEIRKSTIFYRASKEGLEFLRQYYALVEMLLTARVWDNGRLTGQPSDSGSSLRLHSKASFDFEEKKIGFYEAK